MQEIKFDKITIKNFKSLYDVEFEVGNVNVFIGANGSGKSSILEAIGLLSAAMTDRVNNSTLQRRGVRLSTSALYKSKFQSISKESPSVDIGTEWAMDNHRYSYSAHLTVPKDDDSWRYLAESVTKDGNIVFGRSNRSSANMNNKIGYFLLSDALVGNEYSDAGKYISSYGIFQPDTLTLRGLIPDSTQINPIGLSGGRLADAMSALIKDHDDTLMFGNMHMEEVLELIEWASDIKVGKPKKSNLNPGVPSTRQIIEFKDRYLKDTAAFTGYDASEGALYVLFMLCLSMHPDAPKMFAIDSFDHALNPRLAKKVTEVFCSLIINSGKMVFMTTHNPLVLDGLDLKNDKIRLFSTDRTTDGYVRLNRIKISDDLIKTGMPLSRLWINGFIGGVPELL